jgi:hypothetical protein
MQPLEEFDPNKESVGELDESDVIEPLNKTTDDTGDPDIDDGVGLEDETKNSNPGGDGDSPDKVEQPAGDPPKNQAEDNHAEAVAEDEVKYLDPEGDNKPLDKEKQSAGDPPVEPTENNNEKDAPSSKKIIVSTLIIFMVTGAVIYSKPGLLGLKEKPDNALTAKAEINNPVKQTEIQTRKPAPPGKNDRYLSKIEEINRLRDILLAKKEEIYRLKLYYRNGIVELMDQIYREMREANISTYAQALTNKRIELNLRTIQRRKVYIQELEKPDQWAHNGSEELLFLKRKALLDLQMADIAGGIDLNRHIRYMNVALQKYLPSADKLAVDPPPAEFTPLESIWRQILSQQAENVQTPVGQENEKIIAEICSGNYERIAELTAITPEAARCLTHKNGSELFLNSLKQLTPQEAKYLFKWQGNWICLNSVKVLSPAVAMYLFKWEGNWISLNGLTELPPELALYLTEWKGKQLELMGLKYENSKPNKRTLKYLTLWETMGGKLFVSEDVRNEMARVM